jgi:hypothetical protein
MGLNVVIYICHTPFYSRSFETNDRTVSFFQNEFTPSRWKDAGVERNVKMREVANSRIPSIFDHGVRNSSTIKSNYQKDRALVELNRAVLHSFANAGVTVVDHHTVARQFMVHTEKEKQAGRCTYTDWGWIVPPMSGSTVPVFHQRYENKIVSPNFFSQSDPWQTEVQTGALCPFGKEGQHDKALAKGISL